MRLGIYGGSFNPMHSGHVHILGELIRRLRLDRVLVIPACVPPHKEVRQLADSADRLQMCRFAAEAVTGAPVEVSDIEIRRAGKSYTADTLAELRALYPEDELFLLMGEDMFLTVDKWVRAEQIMALATLCACPRSQSMEALAAKKRYLEETCGARCIIEDVPYNTTSSTQVRELNILGEPITGLVPVKTEQYITEHGLYRDPEFERYQQAAREHLTEKRFYHSRCVASSAVELAKRYGADGEKARYAGILHDIMKDTAPEEQLKFIEQFGIILSNAERDNKKLWHSISGAAYIEHVLGVTDPEILSAVHCHTSGKKDMTLLDKVLFIADYISADRDYPGVEDMREKAARSLEEAMLEGIAFTVNELTEARLPIAAGSIEAYNDALSVLNKKEGEVK